MTMEVVETGRDRLAAAVAALVVAVVGALWILQHEWTPHYSDFIVGAGAWLGFSKTQDLVVVPAFLALFIGVSWFFSVVMRRLRARDVATADAYANQVVLWSIPGVIALANYFGQRQADVHLTLLSCAGFVMCALLGLAARKRPVDMEACGYLAAALLLLSVAPLSLQLVLHRVDALQSYDAPWILRLARLLMFASLPLALLAAVLKTTAVRRHAAVALVLAQVPLAGFYLILLPIPLYDSRGFAGYVPSAGLHVLAVLLGITTITDVLYRARRFLGSEARRLGSLFSPLALFSVILLLRYRFPVGPTVPEDDYHFGEHLVGWWSYSLGKVPYVDYVPAHGVVADDLAGWLSMLFYNGTAAMLGESGRLACALLTLAAFLALRGLTRSNLMAFIPALLMPVAINSSWLTWLALVAPACLWFNPALMRRPSLWLACWAPSVPLVILAAPAQGLLLAISSMLVVMRCAWLLFKKPGHREPRVLAVGAAAALAILLVPHAAASLWGACLYVLQNGPINQIAYGLPWEMSWHPQVDVGLELRRMAWVLLPLVGWAVVQRSWRARELSSDQAVVTGALVAMLLLCLPYAMGRIDPGSTSRAGFLTMFAVLGLTPIMLWHMSRPDARPTLVLLIAALGSFAGSAAVLRMDPLRDGFSRQAGIPDVVNGSDLGLPQLGRALIEPRHLARLLALKEVLGDELKPGETYLDLTNRTAQHFYLGLPPPIPIPAPYNLAPRSQQLEAIARLRRNLPPIALLSADSVIHDGGALALRAPYLFRFVRNAYTPVWRDGYVWGVLPGRGDAVQDNTVVAAVSSLNDVNWSNGHRNNGESLLLLKDPHFAAAFEPKALMRLPGGEQRAIVESDLSTGRVRYEGPPVSFAGLASPEVETRMAPEVQERFSEQLWSAVAAPNDLANIPKTWGDSDASLSGTTRQVLALDDVRLGPSVPGTDGAPAPKAVATWKLPFGDVDGDEVDFLRFALDCTEEAATPAIRVSWQSADQVAGKGEFTFAGHRGWHWVPLGASAGWFTQERIVRMQVELTGGGGCGLVREASLRTYK